MSALISTLLGAASSAFATLVAPTARAGTQSAEGSESTDFATTLNAALETQGTTVNAEVAAQTTTGEALAAALEIANSVGAEFRVQSETRGDASRNRDRSEDEAEAGLDAVLNALTGLASGATATAAALTQGGTASTGAGVAAQASGLRNGSTLAAAGALASAEAAAAARATTPADPTRANRSVGDLDPQFRTRLDRVIDRMEKEYGHKVTVVETVRSQERQNYLYAQGRTRPGPVVTWTLNSNHRTGRAADVTIDGTYDNAVGYRRLAEIAVQEGLQTLGPKDPGHIELPRGAASSPSFAASSSSSTGSERATTAAMAAGEEKVILGERSNAQTFAGVAQVARVAAVAQVAQVATVARVATVAVPGAGPRVFRPGVTPPPAGGSGLWGTGTTSLDQAIPSVDARIAVPATDGPSAPVQGTAVPEGVAPADTPVDPSTPVIAARDRRESGDDASRDSQSPAAAEIQAQPREAEAPALRESASPAAAAQPATTAAAHPREGAGLLGAEAVERVARVLQIQEGAASRELSQMVLRVDAADGSEDRIRIDLRGASVGASIQSSDPAVAERMGSRVAELQRALEQRGLETEYVQIRSATPSTGDVVERLTMATLPELSSSRSSSDSGTQRDRNGSPNPDRYRDSDPDSQRQRSRRDPNQRRDT